MIHLFVSTIGKDISWIHKGIPIEVGAACRDEKSIIYPLRDDTMDNISFDNQYWGELTGLYWIWKNYKFSANDIVGFCHYNKILDIKDSKIIKLFKKNIKWIVRDSVYMVPHDYPDDVHVLEYVLAESYPEYYVQWKKLYNSSGESLEKAENCDNCELFYTTVEEFDNYCDFLFDVLLKVRKKIGKVDREPYHKRYCAFLGERLLSVYLKKNNMEAEHVLIADKTNKIAMVLRRMMRLLGLNRESVLVNKIRLMVKGNRKSSYLS